MRVSELQKPLAPQKVEIEKGRLSWSKLNASLESMNRSHNVLYSEIDSTFAGISCVEDFIHNSAVKLFTA